MSAALSLYSIAFAAGLRPEPAQSVSEWADRYRILGSNSPEPGPWRTDRVPYMREPMDCLSPHSGIEEMILMKAAQGAGTEGLLNAAGCWADKAPGDILIVMPTTSTIKKFSRKRLGPMIDLCPQLREKFAIPRAKNASNTMLLKEFVGGTLTLTGANSAAGLRSDPIRYLLLDEVDAYEEDIDKEGNPVELARKRTAAFRNRKIGIVSTPTLEEISHIFSLFKSGDQRYFHVPCPLCGFMQRLVWRRGEGAPGGVIWPKGKPEEARYQCEQCAGFFEEWRKSEILLRGSWIPSAPGNGGPKRRSYQISALYYPYGWPDCAWGNLAAKWERDHKDPVKLKTFINLNFGEPFRDSERKRATIDSLVSRCETYGPAVPVGVGLITVGTDVQSNRIEAEKVGWGRDEESWSLEYRVFIGDTSQPAVWRELDSWLLAEDTTEHGVTLRVSAVCVDTNYQKEMGRAFCADRFNRRVFAIIGRAGQLPVWPQKPVRSPTNRAPIFNVGVDSAKEIIYARLDVVESGPGCCHFSTAHWHRDGFEQLTAEVRVPIYKTNPPTWQWRKKNAGARNERLDVRGYAYAALKSRLMAGVNLNMEVDRVEQAAKEIERAKTQPVFAPPVVTQRRVNPYTGRSIGGY